MGIQASDSSRRISGPARHGRAARSPVGGPYLPPLRSRADVFESTIAATIEYLRGVKPQELAKVIFEMAALPENLTEANEVDRWFVSREQQRVVFYRLPIERLTRFPRSDDVHRRMMIESYVFRAVAELLDIDPWDLSPQRYRYL